MRKVTQFASWRACAAHPIAFLHTMARGNGRRKRNLAELGKLDTIRLDDIGIIEATRQQILRVG